MSIVVLYLALTALSGACAFEEGGNKPDLVPDDAPVKRARLWLTPLDGLHFFWDWFTPLTSMVNSWSHAHCIVEYEVDGQTRYRTLEFAPTIPDSVGEITRIVLRDVSDRYPAGTGRYQPDSFWRIVSSFPAAGAKLLSPRMWYDLTLAQLNNIGRFGWHDSQTWVAAHREGRKGAHWEAEALPGVTMKDVRDFNKNWGTEYDFGNHNCHRYAISMYERVTGEDKRGFFLSGHFSSYWMVLLLVMVPTVVVVGIVLLAQRVWWFISDTVRPRRKERWD